MEKPPLVVLGFSGNALDALDAIESRFRIVAYLDDNPDLQGRHFEGVPLLPATALVDYPEAQVICLIGSERNHSRREAIIARFGVAPGRFATIVHPAASVSRLARLGRGVVVFPGAVVTSNAVIGDHVMVLPQTVIHHDSRIGDYTLIGSHVVIAGHVTVGRGCYLGSACSIRNGIGIGDGALIGMAANVVRDVPAGTTVVGNPARAYNRVAVQAAALP